MMKRIDSFMVGRTIAIAAYAQKNKVEELFKINRDGHPLVYARIALPSLNYAKAPANFLNQ